METEELVQGQSWDEIQISSVLVQGLTHDWLRLSHPDPFFSIFQLGGLFLWPSLPFHTTFWGATSFTVRPERRWLRGELKCQRGWLSSLPSFKPYRQQLLELDASGG